MNATLFTLLKARLRRLSVRFGRFVHRSIKAISTISAGLDILSFIAAVAFIVCVVIHTGYDHSITDLHRLGRSLRTIQAIFTARVLFELIFRFRHNARTSGILKWVADAGVLLLILPWIYPRPGNPWIPWLDTILYSPAFYFSAMGLYALLAISYGVIRCIGRRTNPSLLLSGSFLIFILAGSLLLMLPRCTYGGISYIDALFVSTSAVCITGLTPVDVSVTFTPMGQIILAILIQIGALGVMTFTSFFAMFFSGGASIYNQLLLRDMIYSRSMNALVPTLLYILGFTVVVELAGAGLIYLSIAGTLGPTTHDEIMFSLFHSLSSFCNAGFSTLPDGMSNPLLLFGNISIYWITTLLIIAGSIGFPILVNFKDAVVDSFTRHWRKLRHCPRGLRNIHPYNMNTKIVLVTFMALFIIGTAAVLILEWDNTLAGMTLTEKVTQAAFNSAVPRSAGFASVNPAAFLNSTLLIVLFLMWIGGASQSTGGGIKVNTFAAILLNLRAIILGRSKVTAFRRTISLFSIRRANAVVALSILSYTIYSFLLLVLEPGLPTRALLFEASSALFTVGSSLGITADLSVPSKAVLSTAMFLGRVGIISLLTGLAGRHHETAATFPQDTIIIN